MKKKKPIREDKPSRASIHPGSTTQGGSDHGQGSSQLGKKALKQGSEKGKGSNYENEQGWDNEELPTE
jgi:hypothetical protein